MAKGKSTGIGICQGCQKYKNLIAKQLCQSCYQADRRKNLPIGICSQCGNEKTIIIKESQTCQTCASKRYKKKPRGRGIGEEILLSQVGDHEEGKKEEEKMRRCEIKNCGTILNRYNQGPTCFTHSKGRFPHRSKIFRGEEE